MKLTALASSLLLAASVSAHATFQEFWVGGVDQVGTCVRLPVSNSPVTSPTSNDIACNAGASASPGLCTVAAGGQATVEMHQQPGDRTCTTEAIGGNHDGPVIVYMAKVDNALTAVGSSANWFKVAQLGLISTDVWGTDSLNSNCGKFVFTVPSCIPAGQYLIRAEVIALHVAGSLGGAQFYVSCYTVTVTGGGSTSPATVSLPGAYSATDPGILFDLYGGYTSYTIPGPAVFTCGTSSGTTSSSTSVRASSSSSTSKASSTSSTVKASSSSSTSKASSTSSTSKASSSSAASTGTAPLYGQCGGTGWTGATTCASGTCTYSNAWYSQCLP